jgi:RNA polymerase sigma factor for flagellar operon FliA
MIERALRYGGQQEIDLNARLKQHAPLVKRIGLHLKGRLPATIELDDLIQVGMLGLVNAIGNYDPSQGASFETYASIRIKGAMLDEVRRHGWSPRSLQQKSKLVSEAIHHLEMLYGRTARDAEIAAHLHMDVDEYYAIAQELASSQLLSLDEQEESAGFEPAGTAEQPEDELQDSQERQALVAAIDSLPDKEKLMMSLYYNEGLNLREIGAVLDVSESRVSQIHGQAMARIRARMRSWME